MKSSGVTRYFSRRDKHHEKRATKSNSKVRLDPFASFTSLSPLLPSEFCCSKHRRRQSQSLETLYHKLPYVLRAPFEDGLLFFQRNTSCYSFSTSNNIQCPSDHWHPQLRDSIQVSPDLYNIFTKEDAKTAADKDAEKKVRHFRKTCHATVA
jgi:hypothetical protein